MYTDWLHGEYIFESRKEAEEYCKKNFIWEGYIESTKYKNYSRKYIISMDR